MKVRITITTTYDFEPTMEHYPEGSTTEDILSIEQRNTEEDPYMLMDSEKSNTIVDTEVLEDV